MTDIAINEKGLTKAYDNALTFASIFENNFSCFDKNHSGGVDRKEAASVAHDVSLSPEVRKVAQVLREEYENIYGLAPKFLDLEGLSGITKSDVRYVVNVVKPGQQCRDISIQRNFPSMALGILGIGVGAAVIGASEGIATPLFLGTGYFNICTGFVNGGLAIAEAARDKSRLAPLQRDLRKRLEFF